MAATKASITSEGAALPIISRALAWTMGVVSIAYLFVDGLLPSMKVPAPPLPGYEWVEYPERFVRVGPLEAWRPFFSTFLLVLLGAWVAATLLPRTLGRVRRVAEIELDDSGVHIRYARGWLGPLGSRERSLPFDELRGALARDDGTLVLHLASGAKLQIACAKAARLATRIEERRAGATTVPAGAGWSSLRFGGLIARGLWAFGGVTMLLTAAVSAGREWSNGAVVPGIVTALMTLLWVSVGWLGSTKQSVTVGSDGVRVDRPWGKRFIPLARIAEASTGGGTLALTLTDGGVVSLRCEHVSEVAERIREAQRRAVEPIELSDEQTSQLARGERTTAAWKEALAGVLGDRGYRTEPVRVADLERLVDDGSADPERRVAAALALPRGEETRLRIQTAAAACADSNTRTALEAAAEEEIAEGALERATRTYRG
jgi:hypothetical protein